MTVEVVSGADPLDCTSVLAEAFEGEPGARWICPDPGGRRRWFAATVRAHATVPCATRYLATVAGVPAGAAVVTPARGQPRPLALLTWSARVGIGCGLGAIRRTLRYLEAGAGPDGATTLEFVGVTPDQRGRGVGRALLERVIADAGPTPLHLTTADPVNVGLYRRFGWQETRRFGVGPLVVVAMLRAAADPSEGRVRGTDVP